MLRMVLLGLLIPLGVGVLAAMELRTPARSTGVVVQPVAENTAGVSGSQGALAKADPAAPRSRPRKTDIKRTTIAEQRKAATDTEPCRLSAFGGLRKALNSADCEI
jgi:hypothetical protein